MRRGLALFGAVLVGLVAQRALDARETAFEQRLNLGCEELTSCQALEREAEARVAACWLSCGRSTAEHRMSRLLRYRAEERHAVREHYRQREASERQQSDTARRLAHDVTTREQRATTERAEREHQRRLELERLRQEHVDRRNAEQRQQRLGYLKLLSAEGRAQRLRRCHSGPRRCEALVADLLDAANDAHEQRALAALNERLLDPRPPVSAPKTEPSKAKPSEPPSQPPGDAATAGAELAGSDAAALPTPRS